MHKFSLTTALSFLLLWSSPGLALVIYDNGEPDLTDAHVEIDATNIRVADDFVVRPDAYIFDGIQVFGSFDWADGQDTEFLVQILEDDNGQPKEGTGIQFLKLDSSFGPVEGGGGSLREIRLWAPDPFELVPGKAYWVVIKSTGTAGWSWRSTSEASGGNSLAYDDLVGEWVSVGGVDLAFNIRMKETCDRMFSYYLFNYMDSEEATEVAACTRGQGGIMVERSGTDAGNEPVNFYAAALDNSCDLGITTPDFEETWQPMTTSLPRDQYRAWKKFLANEGCETVQEGTSEKTVFVTSQTFTGDLVSEAKSLGIKGTGKSGLKAGDRICNALAEQAGLPGTYTAWLSDSSTDAIDRVTNHPLPYVLPDGTTVAAGGFAQIVPPGVANGETVLDHAICVDELEGSHCSEDLNVWTGTGFTGLFSQACADWTDGSVGQGGQIGRTLEEADRYGRTTRWTQGASRNCDIEHRLYCFQD